MIEYIILTILIITYFLIEYNLKIINDNLKIIVKNQIELQKNIINFQGVIK